MILSFSMLRNFCWWVLPLLLPDFLMTTPHLVLSAAIEEEGPSSWGLGFSVHHSTCLQHRWLMISGWWFGTFFYFPFHIWDNPPPIDSIAMLVWLVVWNMNGLFSISYMGCHPKPIDFHSIIFQDGEIAPPTRLVDDCWEFCQFLRIMESVANTFQTVPSGYVNSLRTWAWPSWNRGFTHW